jgi:hypothetical protein
LDNVFELSEGARMAEETTTKRKSRDQNTSSSVGEGLGPHIALFERHLKTANRSPKSSASPGDGPGGRPPAVNAAVCPVPGYTEPGVAVEGVGDVDGLDDEPPPPPPPPPAPCWQCDGSWVTAGEVVVELPLLSVVWA